MESPASKDETSDTDIVTEAESATVWNQLGQLMYEVGVISQQPLIHMCVYIPNAGWVTISCRHSCIDINRRKRTA